MMAHRLPTLAAVVLTLVVSGCSSSMRPYETRVADGRISLPETHEGPSTFDPATGMFYFTRADARFERSGVFVTEFDGSSIPIHAPFSTSAYDAGASISPDGDTILFTSKRSTRRAELDDEWNIWTVAPDSGDATPLPEPVNSRSSDCCAAFAPDGSFLFSSNRGGTWDIYRARTTAPGVYAVTRLSGSINSTSDEWPSFVAPNGRLVLFNSTRPGGGGGDDVYAACLHGSPSSDLWIAQRLNHIVNTEAFEDSGMLTPDGSTLLWSSWRERDTGGRIADIYAADAGLVGLPECRID